MRIISQFKDYYDGAVFSQSNFSPDDLIFIREPTKIKAIKHESFYKIKYSGAVVFCNTIYPFVYDDKHIYHKNLADNINSILNNSYSLCRARESKKKKFLNELEEYLRPRAFDCEWPIVCVYGNTNYMNGEFSWRQDTANYMLTSYQFQKIVSAGEAALKLRHFISNQAASEKPLPKIDNETMIEIKGFDKHSFRSSKRT